MSILQTQISNHFGIVLDTSGFGASLRYPILGLAFYLFTVKYFEPKEEGGDEAKKKPVAKSTEQNASSKERQALGMAQWLMFVHNVILCIFSFLTCVNTFPIVYRLFQTYGFGNALTNGEFEKLYDGKYGYWSHLFYLSKFYEFVDTWIVLSRGKKPLFLQVYHHTGAVLGMWLITITRGTCGYLFVVENSFIHTIMYFYYAMSVLGIQCKNKHFITMAQMIQFVVGTSVGVLQIWLYGARMRFEDKFSLLFNEVYVSTLFILFFQFYQQSYRRPKQVKQA